MPRSSGCLYRSLLVTAAGCAASTICLFTSSEQRALAAEDRSHAALDLPVWGRSLGSVRSYRDSAQVLWKEEHTPSLASIETKCFEEVRFISGSGWTFIGCSDRAEPALRNRDHTYGPWRHCLPKIKWNARQPSQQESHGAIGARLYGSVCCCPQRGCFPSHSRNY
jgi:hypothetical protein